MDHARGNVELVDGAQTNAVLWGAEGRVSRSGGRKKKKGERERMKVLGTHGIVVRVAVGVGAIIRILVVAIGAEETVNRGGARACVRGRRA